MERHPGGSGANTAAWLGVLGAEGALRRRVGLADLRRHARALEACGVEARLAGDASTPDRQHRRPRARPLDVHRPRGQPRPRADDLPDDLPDDVEHVHVSGYSLLEEGPRAACWAGRA
jgi:sugar/nucleoside kinase (ribokinase family)